MLAKRRTVADSVVFSGRGLHSGTDVTVRLHPGSAGIWFRQGASRLEAVPSSVTDTRRCTCLGGVATIEHLMSALAGLGVSDAEIEVEGPEMPAAGGAALEFVQGLCSAGFSDVGEKEVHPPFQRVFFRDGDVQVSMATGNGHWRFLFSASAVRFTGDETFETLDVAADYVSEIAPARTTVFSDELDAALKAGLGQGLDETSCLVLEPSGYRQTPLFVNEAARHKTLDLIGDLYLAGVPVEFLNVTAERSGHRTNVAAAALLYEHSRR